MQQPYRTAQRLSPVVLHIVLNRSHATHTPAQEVIVPMFKRGISTANR
jgi:hypothetical protein